MLRVARRAIRQFYRENVILHRGQVITTEAQLAVIFGQRGGGQSFSHDHCRRAADATRTPRNSSSPSSWHRPYWTSLARSHEHLQDGSARPLYAVLSKRARWKLLSRIGYLTFNVNSLIRPGRLGLTEVPQSPLVARCGSSHASQATEQSLLRHWTSSTPTLPSEPCYALGLRKSLEVNMCTSALPHLGHACLPS